MLNSIKPMTLVTVDIPMKCEIGWLKYTILKCSKLKYFPDEVLPYFVIILTLTKIIGNMLQRFIYPHIDLYALGIITIDDKLKEF